MHSARDLKCISNALSKCLEMHYTPVLRRAALSARCCGALISLVAGAERVI